MCCSHEVRDLITTVREELGTFKGVSMLTICNTAAAIHSKKKEEGSGGVAAALPELPVSSLLSAW